MAVLVVMLYVRPMISAENYSQGNCQHKKGPSRRLYSIDLNTIDSVNAGSCGDKG
jgi:hypothetical protein